MLQPGETANETEAAEQRMNGGKDKGYHWSQSTSEVHVYFQLPEMVRTVQVNGRTSQNSIISSSTEVDYTNKSIKCTINRCKLLLQVILPPGVELVGSMDAGKNFGGESESAACERLVTLKEGLWCEPVQAEECYWEIDISSNRGGDSTDAVLQLHVQVVCCLLGVVHTCPRTPTPTHARAGHT
jgi:hypothetical protein